MYILRKGYFFILTSRPFIQIPQVIAPCAQKKRYDTPLH